MADEASGEATNALANTLKSVDHSKIVDQIIQMYTLYGVTLSVGTLDHTILMKQKSPDVQQTGIKSEPLSGNPALPAKLIL